MIQKIVKFVQFFCYIVSIKNQILFEFKAIGIQKICNEIVNFKTYLASG
jgi:hypothetical protein